MNFSLTKFRISKQPSRLNNFSKFLNFIPKIVYKFIMIKKLYNIVYYDNYYIWFKLKIIVKYIVFLRSYNVYLQPSTFDMQHMHSH